MKWIPILAIVMLSIWILLYPSPIILDRVIYQTNVFRPQEYTDLLNDTQTLRHQLRDMEDDNAFAKRQSVEIPSDSYAHRLFYGAPFLARLHTLLGMKLEPSALLPMEYRMYHTGGHMDWHRDVRITTRSTPQIEMVYTLENTSDSTTVWRDDTTLEVHPISTQPNSILITQGDSVYHKVTPITKGYRSIIKVAYDVLEN